MIGSRVFPVVGRAAPNLQYGNMLAEFKQKQERECARGQQARRGQGRSVGPGWTLGFIARVWEASQAS